MERIRAFNAVTPDDKKQLDSLLSEKMELDKLLKN